MASEQVALAAKQQGNLAYAGKDYRKAIALYQEALASAESAGVQSVLYVNIANSLFQLEDYPAAFEAASRAADKDGSNLKV